MKATNLVLRCYAEQEKDGSWFCICLDLNLAAQGDSAKEVKAKLHSMIYQYVKEALTDDKEYIVSLIPRKAPLSFFMRYYYIRLVCLIHDAKKSTHGIRVFREALPVVPA